MYMCLLAWSAVCFNRC